MKNRRLFDVSGAFVIVASVCALSGCGQQFDNAVSLKISDGDAAYTTKPPAVAAVSAEFTDTSVQGGLLSGIVGITRASDERSISHYVIYWGSSSETKLAGEKEIAVIPKGTSRSPIAHMIPQNTVKPKAATHFLIRTKNPNGEMPAGVSVPIVDKGLPVNAAVSLSFVDTDLTGGWLAGPVSITRASNEEDVSHYSVYWGAGAEKRLDQIPIQVLEKTGANLSFAFKERVKKPVDATHLIVLTKNADGEMSSGISTPIVDKGVPENAAASLAFTDTDLVGGRLGGPVTISRASNESDVSSYALYWGLSADMTAGNSPMVVLDKTLTNLEYMIPAGTTKPTAVTHLIVRTRNADGEMSAGVSMPIVDKGVPVNAAMSVAFEDTDIAANRLGGAINITKASSESDVSHYALYWGSSATIKAFSTPFVRLAKTGNNLTHSFPTGTMRATGASFILVFTQNADGEMFTGVSTPIVDKGLPLNMAAAITFTDTDIVGGRLGGNVQITKAVNEADITDYVLYWGSNATTKLNATAIATRPKSGSNLTHVFSETLKPVGATHILVRTKNIYGEMATGRSVAIVDKGVPVNSAAAVAFTDVDLAAGRLAGAVSITKAFNEADVTQYVLYWGSSSSSKLSTTPLAVLNKTGANLSHVLSTGTVKPSGATHILVFTRNNDGEMMSGVSALLVDKGLPSSPAVSVSFSDTDLMRGRLFGAVSIVKAANESDLTHYVLYWGTNSSTKLSSTSLATVAKTGTNLVFNFPTATFQPDGATHILVFTRNNDGEMASGVSTLIMDKAAPTSSAGFVSFTDTDVATGKLGGIVSITKAVTETDLTHYVLYWGSSSSTKLNSTPIATLAKTGSNLSYVFPSGTLKPSGASHLLVFTRNADGEMASGSRALIVDLVSTTVSPTPMPTAAPTVAPTATPGTSNVTSCLVSGVLCSEAFGSAEISLIETTCSLQNGKLSKGVACPAANKIKGCQQFKNGAIVLTTWAYISAAVSLIDSACQAADTKLVNP